MITQTVKEYFDRVAGEREKWTAINRYYHEDLKYFFQHHIPKHATVLDIGCGLGDLLSSLGARKAVGVDISDKMIELARKRHSDCEFISGNAEELPISGAFEYVILSDTIGLLPDVQTAFEQLKKVTNEDSRVIITYYNYLWEPLLKIAQALGMKMPVPTQNWLPLPHIQNLLYLAGFEVVKKGYRYLFPKHIPYISAFMNRYVAKLPGIRKLCHTEWIVAKRIAVPKDPLNFKTSVIVPCRNEKDNIINAVTKTPRMGRETEIIFVDGNSNDGTAEEIERMIKIFPDKKIKLLHQKVPKGKYDAVKMGFEAATGDILMILDADLTVPPEDLDKFFKAMIEGKGEFINGSRLIYPMEKEAMRMLNILGNKFFGMSFSFLLEQRFSDTLCGTKVLSKQHYQRLKAGRDYFGDFDPFGDFDLIFGASKMDLKIIELPIRYKERVYGTTKIRRFYHGMILLKMCWVATKKLKFI